VTEVPHAGEAHDQAKFVGLCDDLAIFLASTWLYKAGDSRCSSCLYTIWEWEERIAREGGAFCSVSRLFKSKAYGLNPVHLSGADPEQPRRCSDNDRV
jgi:hypothetical protein